MTVSLISPVLGHQPSLLGRPSLALGLTLWLSALAASAQAQNPALLAPPTPAASLAATPVTTPVVAAGSDRYFSPSPTKPNAKQKAALALAERMNAQADGPASGPVPWDKPFALKLLAECGSDKTRLLRVQIYLSDIREIGAMNEVWDAWVPAGGESDRNQQPEMRLDARQSDEQPMLDDPAQLRIYSRALRGHRLTCVATGSAAVTVPVVVTVRDHGPGVAPQKLDQLTTPFFRGDAARTAATGAGLGLAIVDKALQRMGGSLELANAIDGGLIAQLRLKRVQ